MQKQSLAGVRALVMGIGLHGGGVATARWLARRGARVTATDQRGKNALAASLAALRGLPIHYVLGRHVARDFRTHDLIVVNPGVPRESPYLAIAARAKKRIENDASIFYRFFKNPTIGITGTRGKTTTTLWIAELLKKKYPKVRPSGNTPDNALLREFDRIKDTYTPAVSELSSWQLELLPAACRAPHIAVVTNLYRDHLNRYGGNMEAYADAKANIFLYQEPHDALILNRDNAWWRYFLRKQPRGQVYVVSTKPLPKSLPGMFVRNGQIIFRNMEGAESVFAVDTRRFINDRGIHNLTNLLEALLAVLLFDPTLRVHPHDIMKLPMPRMRQEIIVQKKFLTIVNDSCATSPDGTIAALKRFSCVRGSTTHLIAIMGGTDKDLDFRELAGVVKTHVRPEHLILLEGSASKKLEQELSRIGYPIVHPLQTSLDECVRRAFALSNTLAGKRTILFSPGAASFEKFLHEFDRGEQFNKLIKKFQ